jgi:hypothetical protein
MVLACGVLSQVAWGLTPGERFSNLLRDPFCRRVCGHIDPDKLTPGVEDQVGRYFDFVPCLVLPFLSAASLANRSSFNRAVFARTA